MATFEELYTSLLDREINNNSSLAGSPHASTNRQQAINDAQREFADLTECLIRESTITCSCNTVQYMLLSSGVLGGSTDFVRLAKQGVEYVHTDSNDAITQLAGDDFPERPIQWRNRYEPGWRASTSPVQTPSGYSIRTDGGNLYLRLNEPPDIGSSEAAEVRVPYVALPAPMTGASDQPFTVNSSVRTDLRIYHQALPHFAAYKILPMMGDQEGANAQLQKFLGYVARYTQAQRPRGGQHVMMARNYLREASGRRNSGAAWSRDPTWRWY